MFFSDQRCDRYGARRGWTLPAPGWNVGVCPWEYLWRYRLVCFIIARFLHLMQPPSAFTMLGGFWISYGILYWPSSGSLAAYQTSQLGSALGIYVSGTRINIKDTT